MKMALGRAPQFSMFTLKKSVQNCVRLHDYTMNNMVSRELSI